MALGRLKNKLNRRLSNCGIPMPHNKHVHTLRTPHVESPRHQHLKRL